MRIQFFDHSTTIALTALALASGAACASTPGAQPSDMNVAQHEAMASKDDSQAAAHLAQSKGVSSTQAETCYDGRCWTDTTNPTAEHLEAEKKYQKMADDHRAASQALRGAEASACVGVSERDRDMSPFEHRADIVSVERAKFDRTTDYPSPNAAEGAIITFRAMSGQTAQWLQRVVDCHLARNAALGNGVPEMAYCPLVPKDAKAVVSPTGNGFAVTVTSTNRDSAREIWLRATALAPTR